MSFNLQGGSALRLRGGKAGRGRGFALPPGASGGTGGRQLSPRATQTGFRVEITGDGSIHAPIVEVVKSVNNHRITIVQAGTGTGKSIGVPPALLELNPEQYKRIFVCVPTINAAKSLYTSQKIYTQGRFRIGYAADREINYDDDTQIIYATSGHVYLRLLSERLQNADVIILDEFQKSSIEAEMILRFWYSSVLKTKMVIMSANVIALEGADDVKTVSVNIASPFKVETKYWTDTSLDSLRNKLIYTRTADSVIRYHREGKLGKGGILVFCAGQSEINQVRKEVEKKAKNVFHIVEFISGGVDMETLNDAGGKRVLILATNAVETAVTIPNLSLVIDTMREKVPVRTSAGRMSIELTFTTKDNANQRRGRVGRTSNGYLLRMCSQSHFNGLKDKNPSAFVTNSLDSVYLQLLDYNRDLNLLRILQTPENLRALDKSIEHTRKELVKYKLITAEGKIEDAGRFASNSYLSSRFASFLYFWCNERYQEFIGAVYASLFDSLVFEIHAPGGKKIPVKDKVWESIRFFNLYYEKLFAINQRPDLFSHENIRTFTQEHQLNHKFFQSWMMLLREICYDMLRDYPVRMGLIPYEGETFYYFLSEILESAGFSSKDQTFTLLEGKVILHLPITAPTSGGALDLVTEYEEENEEEGTSLNSGAPTGAIFLGEIEPEE